MSALTRNTDRIFRRFYSTRLGRKNIEDASGH